MSVQADIKFRRAELADVDARKARELAQLAFERGSTEYRTFGPYPLLAAAQVYATLATRRY